MYDPTEFPHRVTEKFVVVGGDAAGMSAAGKAKRDDPDREVVVFERGDWVSFGACGLPYYVKGDIADLEALVVVEPRKFVEERGIDLRRHEEVVAVHRDDRTVTVETDDGRYEESYDDLLLATGGEAAMPSVPGVDLAGVFGIRNLEAVARFGTTSRRIPRPARPLPTLLRHPHPLPCWRRATARRSART